MVDWKNHVAVVFVAICSFVVNDEGDVLDVEINDARFSVHGAKERLQMIAEGHLPPEAVVLKERFLKPNQLPWVR